MAIDRKLLLMTLVAAALLTGAATPKPKTATKTPPVTDANVAERVLSARSRADQLALADYYKGKAGAEESRIAHFDQLFRAYMKMEGKVVEPLQRQARALLKAARMSKQRYELLSQAHRNIAYEDYDA